MTKAVNRKCKFFTIFNFSLFSLRARLPTASYIVRFCGRGCTDKLAWGSWIGRYIAPQNRTGPRPLARSFFAGRLDTDDLASYQSSGDNRAANLKTTSVARHDQHQIGQIGAGCPHMKQLVMLLEVMIAVMTNQRFRGSQALKGCQLIKGRQQSR